MPTVLLRCPACKLRFMAPSGAGPADEGTLLCSACGAGTPAFRDEGRSHRRRGGDSDHGAESGGLPGTVASAMIGGATPLIVGRLTYLIIGRPAGEDVRRAGLRRIVTGLVLFAAFTVVVVTVTLLFRDQLPASGLQATRPPLADRAVFRWLVLPAAAIYGCLIIRIGAGLAEVVTGIGFHSMDRAWKELPWWGKAVVVPPAALYMVALGMLLVAGTLRLQSLLDGRS